MSIINKMLQELDKRNAGPVQSGLPRPEAARLTQQVRPVRPANISSAMFWRIVTGSVFVMVAWFSWVMWQSRPGSPASDRADQPLVQSRPAVQAPVPGPVAAPVPVPVAVPAPVPAPVPVPAMTNDAERVNTLRLATEMAAPAVVPREVERRVTKAPPVRVAPVLAPRAPETAIQPAERKPAKVDADAGRIDKRVDATPRQRAENELRRAMASVNEGRIAEGMEGLKASLAADPAYDVARQTLVALLLEAKRTAEAADVLQAGLAINPASAGFAMLLARLTVERGDAAGALSLLQKHAPYARQDPEYRAFLAALYQRVGRHAEAIAEYEFSLQARPGHGAWWAGLGISQEAVERTKDAVESYRRAKSSGNLNAELAAYVDRRLRQVQ